MSSKGTRKRPHEEANGYTPRRPLKPELVREAYDKATVRVYIKNNTSRPMNVSCQIGNGWDWEIIPPDEEWAFPTYKREPIVAATWVGDASADYAEALVFADTRFRYQLVATQSGKTFEMSFEKDGEAPPPLPPPPRAEAEVLQSEGGGASGAAAAPPAGAPPSLPESASSEKSDEVKATSEKKPELVVKEERDHNGHADVVKAEPMDLSRPADPSRPAEESKNGSNGSSNGVANGVVNMEVSS